MENLNHLEIIKILFYNIFIGLVIKLFSIDEIVSP